MKINEQIKELRENAGITQEQLGRMIYPEGGELTGSAISYYENGKRNINLDILERIANLFGYTLELSLTTKVKSNPKINFYKTKSVDDIINLNFEEKLDYIFVKCSNSTIALICDEPEYLIEKLPLGHVHEMLKNSLKGIDTSLLKIILEGQYNGFERDVYWFSNYAKDYILSESKIAEEVLSKAHYLWLDTSFHNDSYSEESFYYTFNNLRLFDENKNDLGIDRWDIDGEDLPLDSELPNELGRFFHNFNDGFFLPLI